MAAHMRKFPTHGPKLEGMSNKSTLITSVESKHLITNTIVASKYIPFEISPFRPHLIRFSIQLGVLKSNISKKSLESFFRKLDFKLFHYKASVQPVRKITTIATRNRCYM